MLSCYLFKNNVPKYKCMVIQKQQQKKYRKLIFTFSFYAAAQTY